uniref:Contactin-associated protein-like 4 n=1 Tax=Knipowitschia caucasica TaxID=637954 RepID=A0AAV2JJW8_KNICA
MVKQSISLNFKTLKNSGTLLHADGHSGHSITLELEKGNLLLHLQTDKSPSSRHSVSLGSLLDDQHWHHFVVEHQSTHLNFTVDKSMQWVQIPSKFSHWDHDQISVGADLVHGLQRSAQPSRNFHGCLENVIYNGLNLVYLAQQSDQRVTVQGNVTFSCLEPVSVAVTFSGPHSLLSLPWTMESASAASSVGLQFRTWDREGLLLTFDLPKQGGVVWIYLSRARLCLKLFQSGKTQQDLTAGSSLSDGQWHRMELLSRRGHVTLTVDGEEAASAYNTLITIAKGTHLYFGGCPIVDGAEGCRNPFSSFRGCMHSLVVNDQPVDLVMVQERLLGNYSQLQIDMCGITDRCSPSHCEHGASCSQSWSTFHCNCSGSGYSGATCHSSIHEQSCEAYKHKGNTSGFYYIDVDGSGPIKPQLVYCNMTEEKTWMVIEHNNTELTRVRGSPSKKQHSAHFEYTSEDELLAAVISQSEHCEQEVAYYCKMSRLFNTQDGFPHSWWVGGTTGEQVQTYWGGAQPGSQQCACGVLNKCLDPRHQCNCDADHADWSNDSGLLTYKESLPVRSLVLRDINRPGSESAYRVGPLRCHGDKNIWNAAFFDKETSYLHFPTFHGELSADISFLFKTTSSSGVFLENLGIKDFIRIELSSANEVLFSFDVGNGPLGVRVKTDAPLNDNRWHRIRAERNIKEASLHVDELPAATREAPADGHIHLQLNSQLFIGGTASRQKGFRGCVRALQMNGLTLDLEARAKMTPGVEAGCPGHCTSYGSLCQHQGRCVEQPSNFYCDCSTSAYTGAFCDREVSASFKSSTSITYSFQGSEDRPLNHSAHFSGPSDLSLTAEHVHVSFRTVQAPALLLFVSSIHRGHLVLLLNRQSKVEVVYRLDSSRVSEVLRSRVGNLANGNLHSLTLNRDRDRVTLQIDQNMVEHFNLTSDVEFHSLQSIILGKVQVPADRCQDRDTTELDPELARVASAGVTGCLSSVLFNTISPLKAALLHPDTSPTTVSGPLVQSRCGSPSGGSPAAETTHTLSGQSGSVEMGQPLVNTVKKDSALIGGVIALVIFVTLSASAIIARFLYRRKWMCRSEDAKTVKPDDCPELPFSSHNSQSTGSSENQKEYFI